MTMLATASPGALAFTGYMLDPFLFLATFSGVTIFAFATEDHAPVTTSAGGSIRQLMSGTRASWSSPCFSSWCPLSDEGGRQCACRM